RNAHLQGQSVLKAQFPAKVRSNPHRPNDPGNWWPSRILCKILGHHKSSVCHRPFKKDDHELTHIALAIGLTGMPLNEQCARLDRLINAENREIPMGPFSGHHEKSVLDGI